MNYIDESISNLKDSLIETIKGEIGSLRSVSLPSSSTISNSSKTISPIDKIPFDLIYKMYFKSEIFELFLVFLIIPI